ncbi:MAG: CDP-archaeol synthase [Clostridia bacterium]|nr:CDP-archaeol synthase [Clostridia bacterium]
MKKRVYSAVLMVIVLALMFVLKIYVSDYFFDVFFCALACVGGFEMSRLLARIGLYNFQWVATGFPAFLLAGNLIGIHFAEKTGNLYWILYMLLIDIALMLCGAVVCFCLSFFRRKSVIQNEIVVRKLENITPFRFSLNKALNTLITFVYPSFIFMLFVVVNHIDALPFAKLSEITSNVAVFAILTALLIPMITDTFAMLTGSVVGGKKLCPKISPKKTISGAIGGTLWCVLVAACIYLIFKNIPSYESLMSSMPIWAYLLIVFFGSAIAQCGDLLESIIKRRAGVKDSGKFLPGHGGLLDRVDSHIFMAPYILIAFMFVLI